MRAAPAAQGEAVKNLSDLELNGCGEITAVTGRGTVAQRLLAMGFLPGTSVSLVHVAPFGDPITLELDGWRVSLRRSEAACVQIRPAAGGRP